MNISQTPILLATIQNVGNNIQAFAGTDLNQATQQLQNAIGQANAFQSTPQGFLAAMGGNLLQPGFLTPAAGTHQASSVNAGATPMVYQQLANQTNQLCGSFQGHAMLDSMVQRIKEFLTLLGGQAGFNQKLRPGVLGLGRPPQVQRPATPSPSKASLPQPATAPASSLSPQTALTPQVDGNGTPPSPGGFAAAGLFGSRWTAASAQMAGLQESKSDDLSQADQRAMARLDSMQYLVDYMDDYNNSPGIPLQGELNGYTALQRDGMTYDITNPSGAVIGQWTVKDPGGQSNGLMPRSPVAFDLNGDGKIGTTGATTAKDRLAGTKVGRTVQFDIDGDGKKDQTEWMAGDGDGLLVDNSDGKAATDMSGRRLFGDEGGKYANGYDKLKLRDANNDGKLTGTELKGLNMWIDNGDAQVQQGEFKSLEALGITEIAVDKKDVKNARGETLMQAQAKTADGRTLLTEDVWFGQKA